jgi:hypothetical protein
MKSLTALSLSIGCLAGVATFFAVGPAGGVFFIWGATIPWAAYFALGADDDAAMNMVVCGIFGVVMAWMAAIGITSSGVTEMLGLPIWAAIVVTATVIVLCYAANIPALACIPASVIGYSLAFAYLLQTPDMLTREVLYSTSLLNPLVVISISICVGVGLGIASNKLSANLTTEE